MMGSIHKASILSAFWFLRRFDGFYHIWAWWLFGSWDPVIPNKLTFPITMETLHIKFGFDQPSGLGGNSGRRMDDGVVGVFSAPLSLRLR